MSVSPARNTEKNTNYEAFKDHMRKQKGEHWKPTRVRYRPLSA